MALRITEERKLEVVRMLSEGYTKRIIEDELHTSYDTINKIIKDRCIEYNPTIFKEEERPSYSKIKEKEDLIIGLINAGVPKTRIEVEYHIDKRTTDRVIKKYNLEYKPIKVTGITDDVDYKLTQYQREVLIGMMLGDSGMEKRNQNARFSLNHAQKQRDYFYHKVEIFKDIMGATCEKDRYDKRTDKTYHCCTGKSKAAKCFNEFYDSMYTPKKIVPEWMINEMTIVSIAYWFMDDGSSRGVFATMCFSDEDIDNLRHVLKRELGVDTKVDNAKCIVVLNYDLLKFETAIDPYIIPSMKYKLSKLYKKNK